MMKPKIFLVYGMLVCFYLPVFAQPTQQVTAIQYFFNTDPGVGIAGNGAIVSVTPSSIINQTFSIVVPGGLSNGFQSLYIRAKDENNRWSVPERRLFYIQSVSAGTQDVIAYQYYFDTDPGVGNPGNGAIVTVTQTSNFNQTVTITVPGSLSNGFHSLYIRTKDTGGHWSVIERRLFYIQNINAGTEDVIAYQYYFDTDPGVGNPGNGAIVPVTQTSNFNQTVAITVPGSLSNGFHSLYIRTQDTGGQWSVIERRLFYIHPTFIASNLTALEYYFDNDPGVGNANPYSVTPGDTLNILANIGMPCLSTGNHYLFLRARNAFGQWSIIEKDTLSVVNGVAASVVTPAGPITICNGDSVTLSAPQIGSVTYQWLLNGNNISGATASSYVVHASGNYALKATCGASFTTSNIVVVSVSASVQPAVSIVANPGTTVCASSVVTFTATPFNGGTSPSFQWKKNNVNAGSNSSTYLDSTLANNDTITCVLTSNANCANPITGVSNSLGITITPLVTPSLAISANPPGPVCQGTLVTFTAIPVNGGTNPTYQWRKNGNNAGTNNAVYVASTLNNNDVIQCIMTSSASCTVSDSTNSNQLTISVNSPPNVSFSGLPALICDSNAVTLIGSPSGGTFSGSGISGNILNPVNTGTFPIVYSFTDILGCSNADTQQVIIKHLIPGVTNSSPVCEGSLLLLNATGGDNFSWTGPNGFSATGSSASISNSSLADTGNYAVHISLTGCPQTADITTHVTILQQPFVDFFGLKTSYCLNESASILSGLPAGGIFSGNGITGNTFTPSSTGLNTITYISSSFFGCPADTVVKTTTVQALPSVSVSSTAGNILCQGGTLTLNASSSASDYLWNTGSAASAISVNVAGTYVVTVSDNNNCTASSSLYISSDNIPHIVASGGSSICPGDPNTLSFNATSLLWSTGETTSAIVVSPSASTMYHVQGTSAAGCNYIDSIQVAVNPLVTPGVVTNMLPINNSSNLLLPLTLSWQPGAFNSKFDLYIWPDSLPQPTSPSFSNITSINIALSNLNYGIGYNWRVISKNGNCFSTIGPVQNFTIRNLPDLKVQNVSTTSTVVAGQNISVSWTVVNNGTGASLGQSWSDAVYLSTDTLLDLNGADTYLGALPNVSALLSGQSYNSSKAVTVPSFAAGTYYLLVKADAYTQLPETNDTNNLSYTINTIIVTIPQRPDLRVTSVISQGNCFSGNIIPVTYTVKNFGTVAANGTLLGYNSMVPVTPLNWPVPVNGWFDWLAVTDQPFLNNNSLLSTFHEHTAPVPDALTSPTLNLPTLYYQLLPDSSYTLTRNIKIPPHAFGQMYIFGTTDLFDHINETPFDGNNQNSSLINVFLTPPPDLRVALMNTPAAASSGQSVPFSYTTINLGLTPTDASLWYDSLYLTTNANYDLTNARKIGRRIIDPLQANDPTALPLITGGSYTKSFALDIPDSIPAGAYYIYVKTDAGNQVFEYNQENNNVRRSDTSIVISNPDLQVTSVICPASASAGSPVMVQWTVNNNGTGSIINRYRYDRIYLSSSSSFNINSATLLTTKLFNESVNSGGSVTKQQIVYLPNNLNGNYHIFVYTDGGKNIYESSENNNVNTSSPVININLNTWADLAVNSFSSNDSVGAVDIASISFSVKNFGSLVAMGSNLGWTDSIFISKKSTWNRDSSFALKGFTHTSTLDPSLSYTVNDTVTIPFIENIPNGINNSNYFFYILVDAGDSVFENTNEGNNIFRSSNSVFLHNRHVDHIVTAISADDTAYTGHPYQVQWTVKNLGGKANPNYYSQWTDGLYFSTDTVLSSNDYFLGGSLQFNTLNTDSSYNQVATFTALNGLSGDFYLITKSDIYSKITGEIIKSNNANLFRNGNGVPKTVHFVSLPPPDLSVTSISAPQQGQSGQPITVDYGVQNIGPGSVYPVSWQDGIYLSTDFTLSPNDQLLKSIQHSNLAPGGSYAESVQVFLPAGANGNYVLIVKTDDANVEFENGNESNNVAYTVINIYQPPPSDLVISNIINPDSAFVGQPVAINWSVNNNGIYPATGYCKDAVYLSNDTTFDANDLLIGMNVNTLNIPPGSFETHSISVDLPPAKLGHHFVLIRTDLLDNIFESNENNNIAFSTRQLFVDMKSLPLNTFKYDVIADNSNINYKFYAPDTLVGKTLLVSMYHSTVGQHTEGMYMSFEKIPTAASHQFESVDSGLHVTQLIVPVLDSGMYYLSASHFFLNGGFTDNISLYATILPFSIRAVNARQGGNTGNVTVKIEGSKFVPNMQCRLSFFHSPVSTDITATHITYVNTTTVFATFNLVQRPPGLYNVILHKPDNSEAYRDTCFAIVAGTSGSFYIGGITNTGMIGDPNAPGCDPGSEAGINNNLQVTFNGPTSVRRGRTVPITIYFGNAGNVDIPIPTRIATCNFVPGPDGPPLGMTEAELNQNLHQLYLEFREPNGPPDVLRAGVTTGITVYVKAAQRGKVVLKLR